jgi:uncharacterized protein YecT (DUF1311 family)
MAKLAIYLAAALAVVGPAAAGVKTAELKADTKVCEAKYAYPETGDAAIDRQVLDWVKARAADFAQTCKEAEAELAKDKTFVLGPAGKYDAELSYRVGRDDAKFFSVAFDMYTFTGGAHPNTVQYGLTFLRPDGRRVFVAELIGLSGLRALSAYAIKDLKRQLAKEEGVDPEWLARGAGPGARNFEAFVLKPDGGMTVQFSPYQVVAYAFGPQTVDVPARVVKSMLRPDPRKPQASFDCTRAATALEKAICADWRLARADRQMAEDYRQMLESGYEPAEKEKLIQSQRAWLKLRDQTCGGARDMAGCLLPLIEKRRTEIGAPQS